MPVENTANKMARSKLIRLLLLITIAMTINYQMRTFLGLFGDGSLTNCDGKYRKVSAVLTCAHLIGRRVVLRVSEIDRVGTTLGCCL
jgi:hypothetical protein